MHWSFMGNDSVSVIVAISFAIFGGIIRLVVNRKKANRS